MDRITALGQTPARRVERQEGDRRPLEKYCGQRQKQGRVDRQPWRGRGTESVGLGTDGIRLRLA